MKKTDKKTKTHLNANRRESNANSREYIRDHSRYLPAAGRDLRKFALNRKSFKYSRLSFQDRVLQAACRIPFGQVRSYAWVAKQIGSPKAVRAVGQALKKNPYPLIIPCHRVIGSDGSLGGYSGGLRRKRLLIDLEKYLVDKLEIRID